LLLTGDSQADALENVIERGVDSVDVLQVPHHGSGSGLSGEIVGKMHPKAAVISVGAENRYGHPNGKIIEILMGAGVKVLRTDKDGDVEIVTDGERFWVK